MSKILTRYGIKYKEGRNKYAYRLNSHGEWVVSTKPNNYFKNFNPKIRVANGYTRNHHGKSSSFTYLEAKSIVDRIASGETTLAKTAKHYGVDRRTVERSINWYNEKGKDGFLVYGDQA